MNHSRKFMRVMQINIYTGNILIDTIIKHAPVLYSTSVHDLKAPPPPPALMNEGVVDDWLC